MFNLIKNEIYKIFKTKKIYVFMLVIFIYNFLPVLEQVTGAIEEADVVINGQNIAFYMLNFMITNIMPIFIIVSISDMITGEYVNGTLILPLTHSVSRIKLLTAKIIALFIPLAILLLFSLVLSYALGTAIFGWGDQFIFQEVDQPLQSAVVYSTQEGIIVTFASYMLSIFPLLAFGMMIMLLALHFNSSGVTVGISIGLLIFLSILGSAVERLMPYLITNGFSLFKILYISRDMGEFIATSIVTAVYAIAFFLASVYIFNKKDLTY
ncbi:MAG: hypothetical protein APF76_01270 [Desulfitibacter sp. BRH_c19]|nr:MAG: hypothetical protein APF76_01270 [Desulfitibacter sp. BRH_c19]